MKRFVFALFLVLQATVAFAQNQRVSGTLSGAGQSLCLTELDKNGAISVQAVSPAAWDASVQFYVSNNGGANDQAVTIEKETTAAPAPTQVLASASDDGLYRYNATGFRQFCAKMTNRVSGSVNLTIEAGSGATTPTKNVNAVVYQGTQAVGGGNPMWVQGDVQVNANNTRVDGSSSTPTGTEYGLIVRNIPKTVAMSDATANPTIEQTSSFGMLWNTITWDRWRGDTSSGAWVNPKGANIDTIVTKLTDTANNTSSTASNTSGINTRLDTVIQQRGFARPADVVMLGGNLAGNAQGVELLGSNPGGTENGIVVRNIPSGTQAVSGTFWQSTQPVSSTQLPAALAANGGLKIEGVASGVAVPISGTVTANAGTNLNTSALALSATQTDRTQKSQVTDGTRDGTVKAGSTAAAAADTSLVVGLSPNSPLPTGSNVIGTVTANAGTNLNTSALALSATQTDRTQKSQVTDGTRDGTVKAGSTAAAAADTSLVVALSPNSPIPTGSNTIGTVTANAGTNLNTSALALDATITGRWMAAVTPTEATANPTTTGQVGFNVLYNNSNWDREHGNWYLTTGDTGTKAATFNGITQTNYDSRGAMIVIQLGTVSGTTPTLSAQLQVSYDNGTTFINIGPALANLTASSQTGMIYVYPANISQAAGVTPANLTNGATTSMFLNFDLPRKWRIVYTLGGTTPSFAITNVHVNYLR